MTDREKVICAIKNCIAVPKCRDCPWEECEEQHVAVDGIPLGLIRDALTLLEAQEPCWISVRDRMPVETHSIFWPWYGKKEWSKAMWREQSDKVLVTVKFRDGSEVVTTGKTHDGVWHTTISRTLEPVVTHWMPLSEPPKEG